MKSKSTRKRRHLGAHNTETTSSQPSKRRRRTEKAPSSSDGDDSETTSSRRRSKKRPLSTEFKAQSSGSEKLYLNTKKGFMESYSKLLGLEEIFERALESGKSSSDSEVSDYSISSFEDPVSDEEPFRQVPASTFVVSTKVRRKGGTEKIIASDAKSCEKIEDDSQVNDERF